MSSSVLQQIADAVEGKAKSAAFENAHWKFEIWDQSGPVAKEGYSFTFRWPPTGMSWDRPIRADITLDLAGVVSITHLGPGLGRINLQGSHGVGIQDKPEGKVADGIAKATALRSLITKWEGLVFEAQAQNMDIPQLVLAIRNGGATEWSNQEFSVWPIGFPTEQRNAQRPLEWAYTMNLWVLGNPSGRSSETITSPSPNLTTLGKILSTIENVRDTVKSLRGYANRVIKAVTAFKNIIKAGRGYILSCLDTVRGYITTFHSLVDETTDLLSLSSLSKDVRHKLGQIKRDLQSTIGATKRMLRDGVKVDATSSSSSSSSSRETSDVAHAIYLSDSSSETSPVKVIKKSSPLPPLGAASLAVLANTALGDYSKWQDIASLNDLSFPYTGEGQETLALPVDVPSTSEAINADPVGRDEDPAGAMGVLIGGAENMTNAILRRLRCPRGYLPHRPGYGSVLYRYIGQPFDIATALSVRGEADRTILEDPRTDTITSLSVSAADSLDAFTVAAQAECAFGMVQISGPISTSGD